MACCPMKENTNIYFRCRKDAANYNEKLYSRENASELLGISVSTLSDYELGLTKIIPPDMVVKMADIYNAPQLCANYCKNECPIGSRLNIVSEVQPLELVSLRLLKCLDTKDIEAVKRQIISISADGRVDENELVTLSEIEAYLGRLANAISALSLICEKIKGASQ